MNSKVLDGFWSNSWVISSTRWLLLLIWFTHFDLLPLPHTLSCRCKSCQLDAAYGREVEIEVF